MLATSTILAIVFIGPVIISLIASNSALLLFELFPLQRVPVTPSFFTYILPDMSELNDRSSCKRARHIRLWPASADSRQLYNPRSNVDGGDSRGYIQSNTPLHVPHDGTTFDAKNTHEPFQIHLPREDPRLFYQSDAYLQENSRKNINNQVSNIYPGREVVRATQEVNSRSLPVRMDQRGSSSESCLFCPTDKTINLKQGMTSVKVPYLRLTTCSGRNAPKAFRFVYLYGPKPGSSVEQGSYLLVGRIMHRGRPIRTCKVKIQINAVTSESSCPVPSYLTSHCDGYQNRTCTFNCRNPRHKLIGGSTLTCRDDIWEGTLPHCSIGRRWCSAIPPPRNGQIRCQAKAVGRKGLAEGSKCRVQCSRGRGRKHWNPRITAVCRRGSWTHELTCGPRRH